ncbi:cytochrome P450 [Actinomycetospora sp. NBRC 106375]|uniref:cytochrome P450 n=1 Tax=Actinomycetospora sp. NBRC 106375 TaxID=3032207 RepID=UPI0024A4C734|nr:cytochrome P450 [Actinomycetospora sp. NBRC 106375]GLZ49795.1 cytochrome P450 [Actinomycetospora sp. NBRC 106375]
MPDTAADLPRLPFPTPDPLGLAPALGPLREHAPVTRVRTRVGDEAWLVTGYAQVRSLLADPRLGRSHPEPEKAARLHEGMILGGPMGGSDPEQERASHQRMRRLLAPAFSARRMRHLADHVGELVDGMIDDLLARERPADLHAALAEPLPALVICELLGVPYADRDAFRAWSSQAATIDDAETSRAGITALARYVGGLVEAKRREPGEDVLSDLVAAQREDPTLPDMAVTGIATGLLFAGHETTMTRIDAGVLRLFPHEGVRPPVGPDDVGRVVEEILRLPVPGGGRGGGLIRYAHDTVEVDGVTIAPGEAVVLSIGAANQDPTVFAAPTELDRDRAENPHLGFGHGVHHCVGASLARVELREVFAALPARVPTLRVAVPPEELRLRTESLTGGVLELPVTW